MTFEEADQFIVKVERSIILGSDQVEIAALSRNLGDLTGRIFNEGKSTNGTLIGVPRAKGKLEGAYSKAHGKKRIKEGLYTDLVDLQFTGDLFGSIAIGKSQGNNVLGFTRDLDRLKASGHEGQRNKPIFSLSEKELDNGLDSMTEEVTKIVRDVFR